MILERLAGIAEANSFDPREPANIEESVKAPPVRPTAPPTRPAPPPPRPVPPSSSPAVVPPPRPSPPMTNTPQRPASVQTSSQRASAHQSSGISQYFYFEIF